MSDNPITGFEQDIEVTLEVRDKHNKFKKSFTYDRIAFAKYDVLGLELMYMLKKIRYLSSLEKPNPAKG